MKRALVSSGAVLFFALSGVAAAQQAATLSVNMQVARPGTDLIIYITGAQPGDGCLAVWSDNAGPMPFIPRKADVGSGFKFIGRGTAASDGSCRFELTPPSGVPTLYIQGATSSDSFATFSLTSGAAIPVRGALAAACTDLLSTAEVWGVPAKGLDLRAWTGSELHFIGIADDFGLCPTLPFYCDFDVDAETLAFGSPVDGSCVVRSLVDPGDALGDTNPNSFVDCCSAIAPNDICNAFDSNGNDTGVDQITALCNLLGYRSGTITREVSVNACPEAHTPATDGQSWTSDFVLSDGYGAEFKCMGFK